MAVVQPLYKETVSADTNWHDYEDDDLEGEDKEDLVKDIFEREEMTLH